MYACTCTVNWRPEPSCFSPICSKKKMDIRIPNKTRPESLIPIGFIVLTRPLGIFFWFSRFLIVLWATTPPQNFGTSFLSNHESAGSNPMVQQPRENFQTNPPLLRLSCRTWTTPPNIHNPSRRIEFTINLIQLPSIRSNTITIPPLQSRIHDINSLDLQCLIPDSSNPTEYNNSITSICIDSQDLQPDGGLRSLSSDEGGFGWEGGDSEGVAAEVVD